jgi:CubicO group peptidase (beta-lactamase class C family)
LSQTKIPILPRNPTLRDITLHHSSFPPVNHILLAVDGTPIISKQSSLSEATRLAQITYKDSIEDYIEYSALKYIMIGYLIKAIGKESLVELTNLHLFKPLGTTDTYFETPDSSMSHIAQPSSISANGTRCRVETWPYRADSIVDSTLGVYSCSKDLVILSRTIQASANRAESGFAKEFVGHLFKPDRTLNERGGALSLFRICTVLDTSTPSTKFFNRLIVPEDGCSTYRQGFEGSGEELKVSYFTGTTKECTGHAFVNHASETNSTGSAPRGMHWQNPFFICCAFLACILISVSHQLCYSSMDSTPGSDTANQA